MPLFDYMCNDCGKTFEVIVTNSREKIICGSCGSENTQKLISPHSSLSGSVKTSLPGPQDTGCCGSSPGHANCAGPGSCCGKNAA